MFCKKVALKYLAKLTGKHVYRGLFQKKFQALGLQLYLNRGSCKDFLSVTFLKLQNGKYKSGVGARAGKYKLRARAGKYKLEAWAGKYKLGARAGNYKLGARARAGGQAKGRGPGKTKTQTLVEQINSV